MPTAANNNISFLPIISEFMIGYIKNPGERKINVSSLELFKYFKDFIKKNVIKNNIDHTNSKINKSNLILVML